MVKLSYFYILSLTAILLMLSGCSDQETEPIFEYYPVQMDEQEKVNYLPRSPKHVEDMTYMEKISALFEENAGSLSQEKDFIDITKAIAWTESRWRHYVKTKTGFSVIVGDGGKSIGIMQINQVYHGKHLRLEDNISYGVKLAFEFYNNAKEKDCQNGSNKGKDIFKIIRRTYAQYNAGTDGMCRNRDDRDDRVEKFFSAKPWYDHLKKHASQKRGRH